MKPVLIALALFACNAFAQPYPSKPLRLVIPFAAGGTNDTSGRIVTRELSKALGQSVVNRNGVPFRSVEQLAGELRRASAQMQEPIVVISADANATHQSVIRVMEASRLAGLAQITFTTQSNK